MDWSRCRDPFILGSKLWPHVALYDKQRQIVESAFNNYRTVVPAGHMLGKDFVTAFIVLTFFLTRYPCRIVTTSVDGPQLEGVLWGEMRNFINTSAVPLSAEHGGPLVVNHLHLRRLWHGQECGLSYVRGRTAAKGEGMSGHHIAKRGDGILRTMSVVDEASGVDEETIEKMTEWNDTQLLIGNPYDCENSFRWSVEGKPGTEDVGGDILGEDGRYLRKVLHITGEDSPNVKLWMKQKELGLKPRDIIVVPGVLPGSDYEMRLRLWDEAKVCVGVHGRFFKHASKLMFPVGWLDRSERMADALRTSKHRAVSIGIDSGEGKSHTTLYATSRLGIVERWRGLTPDTNKIIGEVKAFGRAHGVPPHRWNFDRGSGKQHADRLRAEGYPVRTTAFGGAVVRDPRVGILGIDDRVEDREARYTYFNRRAQMYFEARLLLEPTAGGYGIPREYIELRRQLGAVPLVRNDEGKVKLPPKHELAKFTGGSPDDADAWVLAVHDMLHPELDVLVGAS